MKKPKEEKPKEVTVPSIDAEDENADWLHHENEEEKEEEESK